LLLEQEQEQEQERKGDLEQDQLLLSGELPVLNKEDWSLCMASSLFFLK
jgi:hypothetical protein